ncbi:hypothetical protein FSP39_001151 [Pinctada imbricata]|uniref:AD domain-containing protein n=1 Tax=Pinctada imbricata TaxID=66713 RepID=A0AA89CAG7_PINIB|nr:hypothetical protein FSP39_001151 [Pinctada imbricata]
MKITMAQEGEFFSIGSSVACTTCYNQKLQGEVVAFDEGTKMLAIKSPAQSGKHNMFDIRMVNLSYVSNIKVLRECNDPPPSLSTLNLAKINTRLRQNLEEKRQKASHVGVGVTPEGQRVFNSIVKTLSEVKWDGKNIIVMDEVTICPPYGVEDCKTKREGSQALSHVRKIVSSISLQKQEFDFFLSGLFVACLANVRVVFHRFRLSE